MLFTVTRAHSLNLIFHRLLVVVVIVFISTASLLRAEQPNILVILADDMGYGDLNCLGSEHLKTPHCDALRESGVLCTQAYVASPVCSPSRAGLMTGRDPRRFGYEGNLNQSAEKYATRPELLGLPSGEWTLGDHLKASGYSTSLIGKWHLGTQDRFHPNQRGFDYFCGMLVGSHGYFPDRNSNRLERNGRPLRDFSSSYLTDFFTDEAIKWIDGTTSRDQEKPWFLFLSYNAPHGPLQAKQEDLERFQHIQDPKRQKYAAMMYALDRGVGRIVNKLQAQGAGKNTLICFFSDNGGATNNGSWNGPLSGVKGCLKEGGIRVPMIWSWPGSLPPKSTFSGVVSSLDLLPTLLTAAGSQPLPLAAARSHEDGRNRKRIVAKYGAYDGIDLLPLLTGKTSPAARRLFWRLQGQTAVLDFSGNQNDKLIVLSHRPAQLFRPQADPGEREDLAHQSESRTGELFTMIGEWEAMLPTVPLWGSSPFWAGQSSKNYDTWPVRSEPH
ncbi:sulfatase-like hydrolase/transferase [Mariniblastus sp.]|nr:sulfatase-like hydrolase/transferase [Mariniblastus sp.]